MRSRSECEDYGSLQARMLRKPMRRKDGSKKEEASKQPAEEHHHGYGRFGRNLFRKRFQRFEQRRRSLGRESLRKKERERIEKECHSAVDYTEHSSTSNDATTSHHNPNDPSDDPK